MGGRCGHLVSGTTKLDIFKMEVVQVIYFVSVLGDDHEVRAQLQRWQQSPSDLEGCLHLSLPEPSYPNDALNSKTVPILCLVDSLLENGLVEMLRKVVHTPDGPLEFDARHPQSKRTYMQCVIAREALFVAGAKPFPSTLSQAFYRLLLKSPREADPTKSALECLKQIAKDEGNAMALRILEVGVTSTTDRRLHPDMHAHGVHRDDGDASVAGGDENASVDGDAGSPNGNSDSVAGDGGAIPRL